MPMRFALSTRWNAYRHGSGEDLIEEVLSLGFNKVELGYDLTPDLVPGVADAVKKGRIKVDSVHAVCPVPVGAPFGHPELLPLSSLDERTREGGIQQITRTIRFASEMGARCVVLHGGSVRMRMMTRKLIALHEKGKQFSRAYEKTKIKLLMRREKKADKHLENLRSALERLLPELEDASVSLALENLPSWESVPSEAELLGLLQHFDSPRLRYWHDIGHGQVRQNLGFIGHRHWLATLKPWLAGMHIHDVVPPARDHLMPPRGDIDFSQFSQFVQGDIPLVLEPAPGTPESDLREACSVMAEAWSLETG